MMFRKGILSVGIVACFLLIVDVGFVKARKRQGGRLNRERDFNGERVKRVINGQVLKAPRWPSAAIIHLNSVLASQLCGGTLLNARWVLTSANCVKRAQHNPSWVTVKLGELFLSKHAKENVKAMVGKVIGKKSWKRYEIHAGRVLIHPDFQRQPQLHDLALVMLAEAVPSDPQLANRIRPVTLPSAQLMRSGWPPDGTACVILGWGCTQEGKWTHSDTIREIRVQKVSGDRCGLVNPQLKRYRMCAGNERGAVCNGDAGGAMVCRSDDQWVQAGVVSMRMDENFRLPPFTVARVSPHMPWITRIIQKFEGQLSPTVPPKMRKLHVAVRRKHIQVKRPHSHRAPPTKSPVAVRRSKGVPIVNQSTPSPYVVQNASWHPESHAVHEQPSEMLAKRSEALQLFHTTENNNRTQIYVKKVGEKDLEVHIKPRPRPTPPTEPPPRNIKIKIHPPKANPVQVEQGPSGEEQKEPTEILLEEDGTLKKSNIIPAQTNRPVQTNMIPVQTNQAATKRNTEPTKPTESPAVQVVVRKHSQNIPRKTQTTTKSEVHVVSPKHAIHVVHPHQTAFSNNRAVTKNRAVTQTSTGRLVNRRYHRSRLNL